MSVLVGSHLQLAAVELPISAPSMFELDSRMADMVALADQAMDLI
jgi:hypothetical protein